MAKNRVIGVNNTLPWHLPEDLKFFKEKTKSSIMIMGRKTFESLPGMLPGRFHIVISRDQNYQPPKNFKFDSERYLLVGSYGEAVTRAQALYQKTKDLYKNDEIFVVGGEKIFEEALNTIDKIYLTEINKNYDGHAYFPTFDSTTFKKEPGFKISEPIEYQFFTYYRD
jgi:dihydrofolate reductase